MNRNSVIVDGTKPGSPKRTRVVMHPLPAGLQTMPNACANVPANPWCSGQVTTVESCASSQFVPVLLELSFGEHIKVASNNETISFTRIYHRC